MLTIIHILEKTPLLHRPCCRGRCSRLLGAPMVSMRCDDGFCWTSYQIGYQVWFIMFMILLEIYIVGRISKLSWSSKYDPYSPGFSGGPWWQEAEEPGRQVLWHHSISGRSQEFRFVEFRTDSNSLELGKCQEMIK